MSDASFEAEEIWKRNEPDSPCKKICVVHPTARLCIGCFRTLDEIRDWTRLSKEERLALMAELPARESQLNTGRKGGRRRRG